MACEKQVPNENLSPTEGLSPYESQTSTDENIKPKEELSSKENLTPNAKLSSSGEDYLVQISSWSWSSLRNLFKANWPYGVQGYCLLHMLITQPSVASAFNFSIYCPRGVIEKGMIAISSTDTYQLYICPVVTENLKCMEESLLNTKVVDWKKDIIIPAVTPDVMKLIDRVGHVLKLDVKCNGQVIRYLYSDNSPPFPDVNPPIGTTVGPLKNEFISLVDATWSFRSETSVQYFKRLLDSSSTYALYSEGGQPLAWVIVDETGSLAHLYSLERCRRQGYASFLVKRAANDLLNKGQHVLLYSVMDNFPSQRLFVKLGFKNYGLTSWVVIQKRDMDVPS
ncbi:glycine N-acyltransferase [Amyelois transitella]|uniref:glycine N-acyltransferase n=1 Tax=Amyelois transitella TaxID=680683 RepID=UPI002990779C|nr:glycine N-acyltransferase [Amyelois transitella]